MAHVWDVHLDRPVSSKGQDTSSLAERKGKPLHVTGLIFRERFDGLPEAHTNLCRDLSKISMIGLRASVLLEKALPETALVFASTPFRFIADSEYYRGRVFLMLFACFDRVWATVIQINPPQL